MPSSVHDVLRPEHLSMNADGRASKRLHKDMPNDLPPSRPSEPTPSTALRNDPLSTASSRRRQSSFRDQTFRDQRASHARNESFGSPTTRSIIDTSGQTSQRQHPSNGQPLHGRQHSYAGSRRSYAPGSSGGKSSISHSSGSFDFLPSANFDDLHASLAGDGSLIDAFPVPGREQPEGTQSTKNINTSMVDRPRLKTSTKSADASQVPTRIGLNGGGGGSLRRHNSINEPPMPSVPNAEEAHAGYVPTAATRARRKSYFPTSAGATAGVRAPRKSVGPGILTSGFDAQSSQPRRPSLAQLSFGNDFSKASSAGLNNVEAVPNQKPKSFHVQTSFKQPLTPNGAHGEVEPFSSGGTPKSPGRPNLPRTTTPSSSKRMSMMPNSAHATGLAARTISPTDARRIKRMSMMPNPLSYPPTPHTPQAETPVSATLPSAPSPSFLPRKSITPSSSRTTPDPNRKSNSSGISNSSNTSYNSFLASNASNRISQSFSTSRLPTPKSRGGENIALTEEEVVPPVPAIPKAYESPRGEMQQPFFTPDKTDSSFENSLGSSITSTKGSTPLPEAETPKATTEVRTVRKPLNDVEPHTERKPNGSNLNRRTLQPLRLPPLNLLPLSTPTTSKIAALAESTSAAATTASSNGMVTPPPRKGPKMNPTTPMTASKAVNSRSYHAEEPDPMPAQFRSNSSHHIARAEILSYRAPSNASTQPPTPIERYATPSSRMAMSPFVSSSLPKTSGDFGPLRREMSNPIDAAGSDSKPSKLTGPRTLQKARKISKDDASSLDTDQSTHSIGHSIRRKLSLTRKRSTSKSQLAAADCDGDPPPRPPKHDDMPPPKLPASATWSGPFMSTPSPTNQSRASRNVSNSTPIVSNDRLRSNTIDVSQSSRNQPKQEPRRPTQPLESKKTPRANFEGTPSQASLSLKDFLREAKSMEMPLDRDDMSAEEEMKKLAAKRKETENAAKELDALRRRATAKERRSPNTALQLDRQQFRRNLNTFEVGEIVDYPEIYFMGTEKAAKHVGDLDNESGNFGYDDERGDYNIIQGDHLSFRYEIIDILGKGSFGQVVRCIDHKTGGLVAIKIIRNKKRFHQQALVEVDILKKLREWDPRNKHSMVNFTHSFYFRGHLCISTELLGMNLYEFIKCHDFRGFSLKLIRRFAKQLLSSLVLLKGHKVIHCDLKPENVLLAHPARSEIKVIDFGSSCLENEKVYTYIQSRFYRSPEVILGMSYGMPIDMWSLGCILAELLTGYPIFPGEDEREQLACIMEVFGPPEKHLVDKSTRKKLFFDSLGKPRITVSSKGKRRRPSSKSLQQALKCDDESFLDFITRCLRWDPERRLKPDDAIHHEFITGKFAKTNPSRPRTAPSNPSGSPVKRLNSVAQTPSSSRPLPDPPTSSFKSNSALRNGVSSNSNPTTSSPIKYTPASAGHPPLGHAKRHSTASGAPPNNVTLGGTKRQVNGAPVQGSALPRVVSTNRVASGMTTGGPGRTAGNVDLAAAAAAVSLAQKSR